MREPTYLPTLFEGPLVPGNGLLLQATWRMSRPRQKGLWLVCGMWYVVCAKQLKSWGEASCWKEVKRWVELETMYIFCSSWTIGLGVCRSLVLRHLWAPKSPSKVTW